MLSNRRSLLLFRLKIKRLAEWSRDLSAEKPGLSEFHLMGKLLLKAALSGRSLAVGRHNYFQRLLTCHRCPVFDRKLKRCRNGERGCGCYMPFKALAPVSGWLRETGQKGCWGADEYLGPIL